jgi:protein-L-isoaspartate(D-aspartate) O-methyltransferase
MKSLLLTLMVVCFCATPQCVRGDALPDDPPAPDRTQRTAEDDFAARRRAMVTTQLQGRDIGDDAVLTAMSKVPRHRFVLPGDELAAYEDYPLPIGHGQTISQPYIVAYMTQTLELEPSHRVLEIGTGSGYQAAVLAEIAQRVWSIEIVPELAERAAKTLSELGYEGVTVRAGNGYLGWPEHAPFDRIIVTAAPPEIPKALVDQLAVGGRLVVPVGTWSQDIVIVTKTSSGVTEQRTIPVRFVPMVDKPPGDGREGRRP